MAEKYFTSHFRHSSQQEVVDECLNIIHAEAGRRYARLELGVSPVSVQGWVSLYGNSRIDVEALTYSLCERLPGVSLYFATFGDDVSFAIYSGPDLLLQLEQVSIPSYCTVKTTMPVDEVSAYLGLTAQVRNKQTRMLRSMLNSAVLLDFSATLRTIDDLFNSLGIIYRLRPAQSHAAYEPGFIVFNGTQTHVVSGESEAATFTGRSALPQIRNNRSTGETDA